METVDTLFEESIQLVQAKNGYRFSLDPVLLADFTTLPPKGRVLDLGAGCGVLAVLLARRGPDLRVIGWERQTALARRAVRGAALSGLAARVVIVETDLRDYRRLESSGSFDLVVTNPPYRPARSGRVAPQDERAAARHELAGGLEDFLAAASWCLIEGGRFAMIHLAERLSEIMVKMSAVKLEPKRLRLVHPRRGDAARMVLIEARKGGAVGLKIEPPLYVYEGSGPSREYTEEVLRIYGEKTLS
jgi:tRNA1Val (adenine37-N6)-methyltransferase